MSFIFGDKNSGDAMSFIFGDKNNDDASLSVTAFREHQQYHLNQEEIKRLLGWQAESANNLADTMVESSGLFSTPISELWGRMHDKPAYVSVALGLLYLFAMGAMR